MPNNALIQIWHPETIRETREVRHAHHDSAWRHQRPPLLGAAGTGPPCMMLIVCVKSFPEFLVLNRKPHRVHHSSTLTQTGDLQSRTATGGMTPAFLQGHTRSVQVRPK
jgi:hypothetical protein